MFVEKGKVIQLKTIECLVQQIVCNNKQILLTKNKEFEMSSKLCFDINVSTK